MKEKIIKGLLYGFDCNLNNVKILNTKIPSDKFFNIIDNIDPNINKKLTYNCCTCHEYPNNIILCKKCNWAIFCSEKCFKKKKNHICN